MAKDEFDLIVIGGGISGLGVAIEAVAGGLSTLVLERGRCCAATSANSLRIIHGGFRYLQGMQIGRVVKSLRDQRRLMREASAYLEELPCIMPLQRFGMRSALPVRVAQGLYRVIAAMAREKIAGQGILSAREVEKTVPVLRGHAPYGALLWHDVRLKDPDGMTAFLKGHLEKFEGVVHEGSKVLSVHREGAGFLVAVQSGDNHYEVSAKAVANATGPWLWGLADVPRVSRPGLQWCRAFNLELRRELESRYAIGIKGAGGRLYFLVPRDGKTAVGTGYLPWKGDPADAKIAEAEAVEFLEGLNSALPELKLTFADVNKIECGVLPQERMTTSGPVPCGHERMYEDDGYVEILSTKYTTFLSQGRDAVKLLLPHLRQWKN